MDHLKVQVRESGRKLLVEVAWDRTLRGVSDLQIDQEVGLPAILKILAADSYQPTDFDVKQQEFLKKLRLVIDTPDGPMRSDTLERDLGARLFKYLFPDDHTRGLFFEARNSSKSGLDLALELDATSTVAAQLPWELLWSEPNFLTLGGAGTLSRRLIFDGRAASRSEVTFDKLRVLVISPRPLHEKIADLGNAEIDALEQLDGLQVKRMEPPTIQRLGAYLDGLAASEAPHVIHFDGHGTYGRACRKCKWVSPRLAAICASCGARLSGSPQGYLAWEGMGQTLNFVSAEDVALQLGMALTDLASPLRLVVLSACRSALAIGAESEFSGVAQRLITTGVPGVVAMRYPVEVGATIAFSSRLYTNLVSGKSLADAVRRARTEIKVAGSDQWHRPALYLDAQADEGSFFRHIAGQAPTLPSTLSPRLANGTTVFDEVDKVESAVRVASHTATGDRRLSAAVLPFRTAFVHCRLQLAKMADYKDIHDKLHDLSFWYGLVMPEVEREGGPSPAAMRVYGDQLGKHISGLDQIRDRGNLSNRDLRWVGDLLAGRTALRQITDAASARTNAFALQRLGSTLASIPAEMNAFLDSAAQALRLTDIEQALESWRRAAPGAEVPGTELERVAVGVQAIGRLNEALTNLISEHGLRQELEREIRLVRSAVASGVETFAAQVWPELRGKLEAGWLPGLELKAAALNVEKGKLDTLLAANTLGEIAQQFENCASAADDYFYSLDLLVKSLCERLRGLGETLDELVEAVDAREGVAA